jgi:hypothetical protein
MEPIENFKALSYRLLIFGFQPADLILIAGLLFVMNLTLGQMIPKAFYAEAGFVIMALSLAKKASRRPDAFFTSLMMFIITPLRSGIDYYKDVVPYREVLERQSSEPPLSPLSRLGGIVFL